MKTLLCISPPKESTRYLCDKKFGEGNWAIEYLLRADNETEEQACDRYVARRKELGDSLIDLRCTRSTAEIGDKQFRYVVEPAHIADGTANKLCFPLRIKAELRNNKNLVSSLNELFGLEYVRQSEESSECGAPPDIHNIMEVISEKLRIAGMLEPVET